LSAVEASGIPVRRLDASDPGAMDSALEACDIVVNALPYAMNLNVMRAALRSRAHYVDLGGLFHMTRRQLALDGDFKDAGLIAILGCGSAPGITNMMARVVANRLDALDRLDIRLAALSSPASSAAGPMRLPYAVETLLDEFTLPAVIYRHGVWEEVPPLGEPEEADFPPPIGRRMTFAFLHSELATLPHTLDAGLNEVTYKAAVDEVLRRTMETLVALGFHRREPVNGVSPRALLSRVILTGDAADDLEAILVNGTGRLGGRAEQISLSAVIRPHTPWAASAGAYDTGVPASIIAGMIAGGTISAAGVHAPESVVPVGAFFDALGLRGIRVQVRVGATVEAGPIA